MSSYLLNEVINDVEKEYWRAQDKHGEFTLDGSMSGGELLSAENQLLRLGALMEEVGEVAEHFTYDKLNKEDLYKELIQVANVALTWATILR